MLKNYALLTWLLVLLILGGTAFRWVDSSFEKTGSPHQSTIRALFPQSFDISEHADPLPHWKIYADHPMHGRPELSGLAFHTAVLAPDIKGYGGEFDLLVGLSLDGTIVGVQVLEQNETPAYAEGLKVFLTQFSGKNVQVPLTVGQGIDGISGATISSVAFTQAISQSGTLAAKKLLTLQTATSFAPGLGTSGSSLDILAPLLLFAIAVAGILTQDKRLRWLALILGLLTFGLIHANMISVVQLANLALGLIPGFAQSPLLFIMLGLAFVTSLCFGMTFCGLLCPFAATEELIDAIARKLKIPQIRPSAEINAKARYIKYVVLFVVLAVSFWQGNTQAAGIEPFLTLFTGNGSFWAWTLVGLMLTAALFNFRFWCKYFCPVGAFFGLLSRFSFYKVRLTEGCASCQSCVKACPTDAITLDEQGLPVIDHPECIVCGACVRSCSKKGLRIKGYDGKTK